MEFMVVVFLSLIIIIFYLVLLGIAIVNYILTSLSLQTLAKRRQIKNPFLAWIPIASYWLIGSLADDYDYVNSGIDRKWRKILLIAAIAMAVTVILMCIIIFTILFSALGSYDYTVEVFSLRKSILMMLIAVPVSLIFTLMTACSYICIYKIFESTVPEKSVKYFILYLLVPLAGAICLYKCRNLGYSNFVEVPGGYAVGNSNNQQQ